MTIENSPPVGQPPPRKTDTSRTPNADKWRADQLADIDERIGALCKKFQKNASLVASTKADGELWKQSVERDYQAMKEKELRD